VLEPAQRSVDAATEAVTRAVQDVVRGMPESSWPIGVGVSVPGTVRAADGFVEAAPNLEWRGAPFGAVLRRRLPDLPVLLANDADMGVLAEHLRGAARGATEVVYVTGKVGVGAGILLGGQRLRGAGGLVGEVGHTVLDPQGRPCHCGGRGCVEGMIGEEALLRLAGRSGPPDPVAVAAVLADARAGDPAARAGVDQVARALGQVLANLVNLLNPQVIVLGGVLAHVYGCAESVVLAELDGQAMAAARGMVDIRVSALADDSSLLGAAELAFQRLLADPLATAPRWRDAVLGTPVTSG
jgi:predicted NBD/HSP70 family sugar kinase